MRRLLGAAFAASPSLAAAGVQRRTNANDVDARVVVVDQAWGGTGVSYDAVSIAAIVYIAYYDADRMFTVARVDTSTGGVVKKRLDSRFTGWDAHNSTALELDADGRLHVSGNMHTAPLVYARMQRPDDMDSLQQVDRMVGTDESSVTYPRFFHFPHGALGFSYRFGRSGNGVELINRFDGERWRRVLSTPLFAPAPGGEHVSAYHTDYMKGPDGRFHVAWVWRQTTQAETTFDVMYARSADLEQWEDSRGRRITLPITPANAEVVVPIPPRNGLINNVKLGFDAAGAPVISFLRYDERGRSQLYHARRNETAWQVVQSTDWDYRWAFSGAGTLVGEIGFGGVRVRQGVLTEDISHRKYGRMELRLDPRTLAGAGSAPATSPGLPRSAAAVAAPYRAAIREIRQTTTTDIAGFVRWRTLGSDNNDRPRTCGSVGLAEGCRMTGPLELVLR
jgi:hypothetical protein